MADRRDVVPSRGDAGDDPGGPDFDWLYARDRRTGTRGGADETGYVDPHGEAEPTRVLRRPGTASGDPGGTARATSRAPEAPPPPPSSIRSVEGSGPGWSRPTRRRSGWRPRLRPLRWLFLLLLAWVIFLVAVPVYAWTSVSTVNAEPSGERPAEQPGTTYLVVGSDARKGLDGRRTDTIMLLHTGSGPNLLLSIPRDSLVPIPGRGTTKINAAFAYGGPRLLVRTVEGATGIRVDDYVEIGFKGFVDLVDAVGGVRICPEAAMKDPLARLDIPKGCQEADGRTALGYARSRQTQQLGDIGRAEHQREVVTAIGREVFSWQTILNPVRYWNVVTGGARSVRVSDGSGPVAVGKFALGMTRLSGQSGMTCGVPIADLDVHWDTQRAERLFELIRTDRTQRVGEDLCRPSGMASR